MIIKGLKKKMLIASVIVAMSCSGLSVVASEETTTDAVMKEETGVIYDEEEIVDSSQTLEVNATNFPDEIFRRNISTTFDTDNNGRIDPTTITRINFVTMNAQYLIYDVKGIELFENLEDLTLYSANTHIESIDLSKNVKLRKLNLGLGSSRIDSLDLSSNVNLEELSVNGGNLTSLDLKKNVKLQDLSIISQTVESIDISNCTDIRYLTIANSLLTSIDVSKNINLINLSIQSCKNFTSLNLGNLTTLEKVNLSNLISFEQNIDLSKNKNLKELWIDNRKNSTYTISSAKGLDLSIFLHKTNDKIYLGNILGDDFSGCTDSNYDSNTNTYSYELLCSYKKAGVSGFAWYLEGTDINNQGPSFYVNTNACRIRCIPSEMYGVSYTTHVQSYGWQYAVGDGTMSGTSGEAKRLEAIEIAINDIDGLGIQYSTHCQTYGWLPWSCNGEVNGTSGEAKRLEAIKIQLTGDNKDKYDIYYRVHAQSYGWLGWAKNGEPSGTAGYAKRLEGIQIVLVEKGEAAPGLNYAGVDGSSSKYSSQPYVAKTNETIVIPGDANAPIVSYKTHVQSFGWQKWVHNGAMSGTSGQAKRLEGINIKVTNCPYEGDIVYTTHVQTYGWQGKPDDATRTSWKKNGEMSGTSGEAKRLEAICIDLTGEMGEKYDIYYRVHAQSFGWLGWAKNGEESGTAGYAKRLEGIQIVLVPAGGEAPANNYGGITSVDSRAYVEK